MWVNNVFMPDSWKNPIPDYETFIGNGIGKLGIDTASIEHGNRTEYEEVMNPLIAKYNTYSVRLPSPMFRFWQTR